MSEQVKILQTQNETSAQNTEQNRFLACEEIVDDLLEQGLPSSFVPENFISKISKTYNVSLQEARTCLKLAIKQLEIDKTQNQEPEKEKLYAQSGYFYPSSYSQNRAFSKPKDGMDSLSSLGSYNRLMFGIR